MGVLTANYPFYLALSPFILPAEKDEALSAKELRYLLKCFPLTKAFGGHCVRSYLEYTKALKRNVDYITFLREPVARYFSHYNHQRGKGAFNDIETFLADDRYSNVMVKKIAGEANLDAAIEAVENKFAFVGLVERFDESLLLCRSQLGIDTLDLRYKQTNKSWDPNYQGRSEINTEAIQDAIREANQLDIKLYEHVKTKLWPRYLKNYGAAIHRDTESLVASCVDFENSQSRASFVRAYRWLGYRNIELILRRAYHGRTDTNLSAKWAILRYRVRKLKNQLKSL